MRKINLILILLILSIIVSLGAGVSGNLPFFYYFLIIASLLTLVVLTWFTLFGRNSEPFDDAYMTPPPGYDWRVPAEHDLRRKIVSRVTRGPTRHENFNDKSW